LAGIDLFVYTLDAQHQAEQALGYFDGGFVADALQTSTEVLTIAATERGSNALVSGLVQHQTLLNAGIGNCVSCRPTKLSAACRPCEVVRH